MRHDPVSKKAAVFDTFVSRLVRFYECSERRSSPLSPAVYVPLGALNSPNSVLRKIPVNVKPNPEKVEKYLFDRVLRL